MEFYREYEMEVNEINKLTKDQQKLRENIQQYEHKRNENEMVQSEFSFIEETDTVYKLIGPILIKTETAEAKLNIEKRLEFINKEITRNETKYKEQDSTIEIKRKKVQALQNKIIQIGKHMQQQQQQQN